MKINNVSIKSPSTMSVVISDIDGETYRNAKGTMIRDRIATKRKLNLVWNALTVAEMKILLQAVKEPFFTVTYLDAQEGTEVTKTFYVGDRTAPVYRLVNKKELWEGLQMNFIEK